VQRAWKGEQRPIILGWVYHIDSGLIDQVCRVDHTCDIDPIYRYIIE
jgi:carbonic anhydrase